MPRPSWPPKGPTGAQIGRRAHLETLWRYFSQESSRLMAITPLPASVGRTLRQTTATLVMLDGRLERLERQDGDAPKEQTA